MLEIYKKAVFCILVLCFSTNVGKAQSNIARRLEILENRFAIQAHENELMREELKTIKQRLSELENGTTADAEQSLESTDVKCCIENEQKTLLGNAAAWQQRDQQIASLRKGFRADKQVREESAASLQNKLVNLNTELETLKSYIKQNFVDSEILNRITASEKGLQEITSNGKELNQTVHGNVLVKIQTMEHSFDLLHGQVTNNINLINRSLDNIKDMTQQEIHKSERNMDNKLANVNVEVSNLKSYIKHNFEDTAVLKRITSTEKSLQEITTISKELNQTVHEDVSLNIQTMKRSFEGLQGKVTDNIRVVDRSLDSIKDLTRQEIAKLTNYQHYQRVAFSARLLENIQHLNPWATLKFNDVIYNDGNSYSPYSGEFTAPRNGVYVFFIHILGSKKALEMVMQKNGDEVLYLYVDNAEYHGSASNLIVLNLQGGDRVKVAKYGPWGNQPFYVRNKYSTFSGYILYPL